MPQQKKNPPRTTLLARYQNIVLYTECIRLLEVVWRQVWGKLPRCECSLVSGGQSEPREGAGGLIVKVALIWKTLKFKETPPATGRRTAQWHEGNRGRRVEASKIPTWNSPLWFSILVLVRSQRWNFDLDHTVSQHLRSVYSKTKWENPC